MTRLIPADIDDLRDAVASALAAAEPLEIVGGGSKRGLGRPMQTARTLDLSDLSGIRDYAPSELVLTAGAGTPLAEIERVLAQAGQMLAFEPPNWSLLLGKGGRQTLGGVLACNLSGPRRPKAGAARDHFLGFRAVSGRGEVFKAGGKVVKNVTGYDLPKLLAGSYGTLAALEEVTLKVLPRPGTEATLMLAGLGPAQAVRAMATALNSPHDVSGAAYLPKEAAGIAPQSVILRVEGPAPSVAFRHDALRKQLAGGDCGVFEGESSAALWAAVAGVAGIIEPRGRAVWRISVAPVRGGDVAQAIARRVEAEWFLDWGGGLLWASVPQEGDAGAAAIRGAIHGPDGRASGQATLVKATPETRRAVAVFEPPDAALAALSRRVKEAFDPAHIFNPGRLAEGW